MSDSSDHIFATPAVLCDICQSGHQAVTLSCSQCALLMCHGCAKTRHSIGALTQHSMTLISSSSRPAPAVVNGQPACERCREQVAIVRCPICCVDFCQSCADKFHNVGKGKRRAAQLFHKIRFEYLPGREPSTPSPSPPPPRPLSLVIQSPRSLPPALPPNTPKQSLAVAPIIVSRANSTDVSTSRGGLRQISENHAESNSAETSQLDTHDVDSGDEASQSQSTQHSPFHTPRAYDSATTHSDTEADVKPISYPKHNPHSLSVDSKIDVPMIDRQRSSPAVLRARSSSTITIHRAISLPTNAPPIATMRRSSETVAPNNSHSSSMSQSTGNLFAATHSVDDPLKNLNHSRTIISPRGHPTLDSDQTITKFRLTGYLLSYGAEKPQLTQPPGFTITVSPSASTVTVTSLNGSLFHSRHFSSLSMVTHSTAPQDNCLITMHFSDTRASAKCLCTTSSEALTLSSLLNSFIDQWRHANEQADQNNDTSRGMYTGLDNGVTLDSQLLACRVEKFNRLRWKPRWLKVSPYVLTIFKTPDLKGTPAGTIHLDQTIFKKDSAHKDKILFDYGDNKRTEYRCGSQAERDMLAEMIERATYRRSSVTPVNASKNSGNTSQGSTVVPSPQYTSRTLRNGSLNDGEEKQASLLETGGKSHPHIVTSNLHNMALSPASAPTPPLADHNHSTPLSAIDGQQDLVSPLSASVMGSRPNQLSRAAKASRRRSRRSLSRDFHSVEVRDFSATAPLMMSPSNASSALSPAGARSTMAFIEWNERARDPRDYIPFSSQLSVGLYQLFASLHASIVYGAYLTEQLYVPRGAWFQSNMKMTAFSLKCESFDAMTEAIHAASPPVAVSVESIIQADEPLFTMRCALESIQEQLHKHLPFISKVPESCRVDRTNRSVSDQMNMKKSIKKLSRFLERAVSATATKRLDDSDMERYVSSVQSVLEASMVYRQWHGVSDRLAPECREGKAFELWNTFNDQLRAIDLFMYHVLLALIMPDLTSMIHRFAKYQYRALTMTQSTNINKVVRANLAQRGIGQ